MYVLLLFSGHVYSHFMQRGMPSITHLFGEVELFGGIVSTVVFDNPYINAAKRCTVYGVKKAIHTLSSNLTGRHVHNESFRILIVGH